MAVVRGDSGATAELPAWELQGSTRFSGGRWVWDTNTAMAGIILGALLALYLANRGFPKP